MSEAPPPVTSADTTGDNRSPDQEFAAVLSSMENDPKPVEEHELEYPLHQLRSAFEQRGVTLPAGLEKEVMAFGIWPAGEGNSGWGGYFGQSWQAGMVEKLSAEVVDYWQLRAAATPHPVMRARYADLAWELPKSKRITGVRPDPAMARTAASSYLDAAERRRYKHESSCADAAQRALEIALQVADDTLIARSRDVLLALDREFGRDDMPGLWIGFQTFIVSPDRRVPLSNEQRRGLVQDMEDRLTRFASAPPHAYHPSAAEFAALHLARYYRGAGRKEDVARVLRRYGEIVRRMKGTAAPIVLMHSLTLLYQHFAAYELQAEADALSELLRVAGEESLADLKQITVTHEVPSERVEAHFDKLLAGDAPEVLLKIALHYIPQRKEVETQLQSLAKQAPISFMLPQAILDAQGRTVAHVGPLDSDLEGNVLKQISENLSLLTPWLREAMRRGLERGLLSVPRILNFLFESPLFPARSRFVLENGLLAYSRGDSIAAIHVLVPQIETALRQLATIIGAPLYTQRRGGGFHARLFDEFLRDPEVGKVLGEDVTTYLRALLSDPRGWNVRNDIAHGLASEGMMQMPVADRVVHVLLVLSLVRSSEEPMEPKGPNELEGDVRPTGQVS